MRRPPIEKRLQAALDECPWPSDIWTMTDADYVQAVPDGKLRSAISGFLMRCGWELAQKRVNQALKEAGDVEEEPHSPAVLTSSYKVSTR